MKKMALLAIAFSLLFISGCSKEVQVLKPKIPKLKTCKVKSKKFNFTKNGNRIIMTVKCYRSLKKQNYRKTVCIELLNKQIEDFNRNFAKGK